MSTKYNSNRVASEQNTIERNVNNSYTEGVTSRTVPDIPDIEIPSCGIEDVDRAVFKLFNEDLPFEYETDDGLKRVPVVFATGERAFVLRRNEPLRDRQGALVLPLVSIVRSSLEQDTSLGKGIGPGTGEIVIKRKLSEEDLEYRRERNNEGLRNQDDIAGTDKHSGPSKRNYFGKSPNTKIDSDARAGVYEIITIPSPRFFQAGYEITIWTQYLQQQNNLIEAFISSYNVNPAKTFRIESPKGYWFVAHADSSFSAGNNFDGFVDEERLVKTSININVTGYIINPKFPGSNNTIRRYYSSPRISFDVEFSDSQDLPASTVASAQPEDYVFDDFAHEEDPLPGSSIGVSKNRQAGGVRSQIIGTTETTIPREFLGVQGKIVKKGFNKRKGETVYKVILDFGR